MKGQNYEAHGRVILSLVAMALLLYSCGSSSNTGGSASSAFVQVVTCPATPAADVSITGATASGFQPGTVSIAPNDIVRWTNNDSAVPDHTVTSATGKFDSGNVPSGHTVCMQFLVAGSYGYYCTIHSFMTGVVNVQ